MKKISELNKKELKVMEVLWNQTEPLTVATIAEILDDKTLKVNALHVVINSLMDKEMIEVVGLDRSGKSYARTFKATITAEDYTIWQLKTSAGYKNGKLSISRLVSSLIEDTDNKGELISELTSLLEERDS